MKKRIIVLGLIGTMLVIFSACGDKDSKTESTHREHTLTEETLVEEIITEEIIVEEIGWDSDNVSRLD